MATPVKPLKGKRRRTRIHLAAQNPDKSQAAVPNEAEKQTSVPIEKEQQWADVRVKTEMDEKIIQMETPPSGVIRVLNSKQRNRKVQVKLPASTAAWKKDPKTVTLQKGLKQAQQEAENLREKTVPREKYEELQQ